MGPWDREDGFGHFVKNEIFLKSGIVLKNKDSFDAGLSFLVLVRLIIRQTDKGTSKLCSDKSNLKVVRDLFELTKSFAISDG